MSVLIYIGITNVNEDVKFLIQRWVKGFATVLLLISLNNGSLLFCLVAKNGTINFFHSSDLVRNKLKRLPQYF